MRSWDDRRGAGLDVMSTLTGQTLGAGAVDSMEEQWGPLGTWAADHVLGDLWSRPQLSRRDRSLIVVTFLIVVGGDGELRSHAPGALNHGVTRSEIDEILVQCASCAGFPITLAARRVIDGLLGDNPARSAAAQLSDEERREQAATVLGRMTGGRTSTDPATARAAIVENLGGVGELAFDWAFGEVWSRDAFSPRDRSLVTLAILVALGAEKELKFHTRAALNHGLNRDEIEEVAVQATVYRGFPAGVAAIRTMREAFAALDSPPGDRATPGDQKASNQKEGQ
ncbi:MAG: carboxymuconolactone decarboxylase family protein [Actinomycetia bacterium]|nr:carboxymuconolactone decarboxylase family protein [Actinomycetes bacterium]